MLTIIVKRLGVKRANKSHAANDILLNFECGKIAQNNENTFLFYLYMYIYFFAAIYYYKNNALWSVIGISVETYFSL